MGKYKSILLILKIYVLVIAIFLSYRSILFFTELNRVNLVEDSFYTVIKAFLMGVRFDVVIAGYILLLPSLVLFILDIIGNQYKIVNKIIFYWIFILFSVSFFITAVDIPYFNQFFSRLSMEAFQWVDNAGFVLKMIFQESTYYLIVATFIIFNVFFFVALNGLFKGITKSKEANRLGRSLIYLLFLVIMFLGVRGRIQEKSPIRIGTAYFSDNSFLNKLGLNPVFTLMRSFLDSRRPENKLINVMQPQTAIKHVQEQIDISAAIYGSPIARKIVPDTLAKNKPNIVLIIMESMSVAKMKRGENTNNLTPFLDSLSYKSYYFSNIYTAGKHTFNGIFSTLFSFPALLAQQPLRQVKKYNGLSYNLKVNGYSTTYFTTHDGQFDNVEGFLKENNFDRIITQSNYPFNEVKTTLGVPDDYMFRFSIPIINKLYNEDKPFFVTFMTASDHPPRYVPTYFTPRSTISRNKTVEYADWSLKEFIYLAKKQPWYSSTIFVFIADHGAPIRSVYDISLDYHHSPLLFYAPNMLQPYQFEQIGSQLDVFPTIMGLLKQPYLNNSLGIDLLKEKRDFAIINDDNKIGVLNNEFLLIMNGNEPSKLYNYINSDRKNYFGNYPSLVQKMEVFAKSNLQVFQNMLLNHEQFVQETNPSSKK